MEELVEAYRTFGPEDEKDDKHGINKLQLKKTMEEYGEKFQDSEEFDKLFEEISNEYEEIPFRSFIKAMMSK